MTIPTQNSSLTASNEALLVDGSDAHFRHFVNGLLQFSSRLLSVRDGFGKFIGLTGIQYSILVSIAHLRQKEDDVTVNQLAEHLHLSGAFVTIETGKLKKLGLVEKDSHPDDKRKIRLAVTPTALALLDELRATQRKINDILFERLTPDQFRMLESLVDTLVSNADRATLDLGHILAQRKRV